MCVGFTLFLFGFWYVLIMIGLMFVVLMLVHCLCIVGYLLLWVYDCFSFVCVWLVGLRLLVYSMIHTIVCFMVRIVLFWFRI